MSNGNISAPAKKPPPSSKALRRQQRVSRSSACERQHQAASLPNTALTSCRFNVSVQQTYVLVVFKVFSGLALTLLSQIRVRGNDKV